MPQLSRQKAGPGYPQFPESPFERTEPPTSNSTHYVYFSPGLTCQKPRPGKKGQERKAEAPRPESSAPDTCLRICIGIPDHAQSGSFCTLILFLHFKPVLRLICRSQDSEVTGHGASLPTWLFLSCSAPPPNTSRSLQGLVRKGMLGFSSSQSVGAWGWGGLVWRPWAAP